MVRAVLEFKKRDLVWLVPLVLVLAIGFVYAVAVNPTVHGHEEVTKANVLGRLRVDQGTNYDVWIQGGSATSGDTRNLALLGVKSTDQLRLNYGGEYTGGVRIQGPSVLIDGDLTVTGDINGGGGLSSYDSGWFSISNGDNEVLNHNLGTSALIYKVYAATSSSGANMMEANDAEWTEDYYRTTGYSMQSITSSSFKLITASSGYTYMSDSGAAQSPSSSRAWSWARVVAIAI